MSGHKPFPDLVEKMSPEAQARVRQRQCDEGGRPLVPKLTESEVESLSLAQYIDKTLELYGRQHEDSLNDIYHAIRQWQGNEERLVKGGRPVKLTDEQVKEIERIAGSAMDNEILPRLRNIGLILDFRNRHVVRDVIDGLVRLYVETKADAPHSED